MLTLQYLFYTLLATPAAENLTQLTAAQSFPVIFCPCANCQSSFRLRFCLRSYRVQTHLFTVLCWCRMKRVADASTEEQFHSALSDLEMASEWQQSVELHIWFKDTWLSQKKVGVIALHWLIVANSLYCV